MLFEDIDAERLDLTLERDIKPCPLKAKVKPADPREEGRNGEAHGDPLDLWLRVDVLG